MEAITNTRCMNHYRVLSERTMRYLSQTQLVLIDKAKQSEDPELKTIMWRLATVLRNIDMADTFLVVHSTLLKQPKKHALLQQKTQPSHLQPHPGLRERPMNSPDNQHKGKVIQPPNELNRLRSADRLIQELLEIQKVDDGQARLLALVDWRDRVGNYRERFC